FESRSRWSMDRQTPMERTRILSPRPSRALTKETLRRARELLPALRDIPVEAIWAGYVDSTPDGVPVIDTDTGVEGLMLAAGLSGHGFGIGPGVGHLVADLVLGRQPITEVAQYRLARFQDSQWGKVASF
ncbi:FAD-binding oxidoreductase, partial [Roseibium sp.]